MTRNEERAGGGAADSVLKLSVALAVLLAGGGVGYYYGLFLPAQAARQEARLAAEQEARQRVKDAHERAQVEAERRKQDAQVEYQDCLNFAELSYRDRWTASCRAQHDADVAALQDCTDDLFATEEGCRARRPIRPERDCALPGQTAQSYADARERKKAECLARWQAVDPTAQAISVPQEPMAGPEAPSAGI